MLRLILLTLFFIHKAQCDLETALSVGKVLLDSFVSTSVSSTDLTAAEELIRGLSFDEYKEKINCKIMKGIKLDDFNTVINRIATRHDIPDDIKESILDGQYSEENHEFIREFKFQIGTSGKIMYGRIATIKRGGNSIDLAYSFYSLQFKLSPRRIEEKHVKRFLGIVYGRNTNVRYEERNLSEKDRDHMFTFYRQKAINGFVTEYPKLGRDEL